MTVASATAMLPASALEDIAYVEAEFQAMDPSMRPLVEQGLLPRATYVLPDGTPMVPFDHAQLLADAGNAPDAISELFRARYTAAGGNTASVDEEYEAWLSGEYGACLHTVSPEAIVAKGALMSAIEALLRIDPPDQQSWRGALRGAVEALDALERPFASYDRERFGGTCSRDRLITATRERFPAIFA